MDNSKLIIKACSEIQTILNKDIEQSVYLELSKVINGFLEGSISKEVLSFYLEEQFDIKKEKAYTLEAMKNCLQLSNSYYIDPSSLSRYPKISVIITTYNRKEFLYNSINSILKQDYPNKEIVVIDDCSSDGTNELMSQYFADEQTVVYMQSMQNRGPGINRKIAVETNGDGEYIYFLDDDDYLIDSNYLSKAVNFHLNHPEVSFVSANVFLQYNKPKQFKVSSLGLNEIVNKYDYFMNFEQLGFPKPISTLTSIFKREALIKMNILDMNMLNDASIYLRSLLAGDAGFIDVVAGVYRIHGNNITFNLSSEFLIKNLEEKKTIKQMAIDLNGYDVEEMNRWFNFNVYDTIFYYFSNSAKSYMDFQIMFMWAKKYCPDIHRELRRKGRSLLLKKQILKYSFIRKFTEILK
ncbi:glycosyltransferase family 2 protein [Paenibacillus apii]|uniref:glycosyltransferase family 2 protein n=1 Tax=Paenibacillus apii TaxID=1850370 RepID=UPI00143A5A6D|nr:glycosyltransferase family A protein [Paenibacillus apii]NJJ41645.1 glycosyltransferase family 2 protein [Paenibacillus apii]